MRHDIDSPRRDPDSASGGPLAPGRRGFDFLILSGKGRPDAGVCSRVSRLARLPAGFQGFPLSRQARTV